jgi:hypothetical protein
VRLLRAAHEAKPLPAQPALADPMDVEHAADYAGTFTSADGRRLVFAAVGKRLSLVDGGESIPLQQAGGDSFISTVAGRFAAFSIEFGRKAAAAKDAEKPGSDAAEHKPPVVEVSYGAEWYVNSAYEGPRSFTLPADYAAFTGRYRSDSAWGGDAHVYVVKGQLTLEGEALTRIGGGLFRVGEEPWEPDTAEFLHIFEGKARLLKFLGADFWRVEVD